MNYKLDFIKFLLETKALKFGDFVTKSGRKTPYFFNSGSFDSGEKIAKLGYFYAKTIVENKLSPDLLFGPAYKGIPLVVTTSIALQQDFNIDLPFLFNRKEQKDHGEGGNLVGSLPTPGDNVTIVEDVITAGTSVRESVSLLKDIANIKSLVIAVDREEVGENGKSAVTEIEREFGIKTYPIVTISEILKILSTNPVDGKMIIDDELKTKITEYLKRYGR